MRLAWLVLLASCAAACANSGPACPRCSSTEVCRAGRCVAANDGGDDDAGTSDAGGDDAGIDAGIDAAIVDGGVDAGVDGGSPDAGTPCELRAHFAPAGATAFEAPRAIDCSSPFAPLATAAVQAVFDVQGANEFYFLTATTFHVLSRDSWTWVASGPRNTLFPAAAGITLRGAVGQELYDAGDELVMLHAFPTAILYAVNPSTRSARLITLSGGRPNPIDLSDASLYPNWSPTSNAFAPSTLDRSRIVTAFHVSTGDLAPSRAGVTCTGSGGACSNTAGPGLAGPHYTALLTDNEMFLIDGFSCFCFFARPAIAAFGPFAAPGAPSRSGWNHTAWNGGLWAFDTP